MKIIQFYILCLLLLTTVLNGSSSDSGSSGSSSGSSPSDSSPSGSSPSGSTSDKSTSDGSTSGDSTSSGSSPSDSSDSSSSNGDTDKDMPSYPDPVEPERTPRPIDPEIPEDVLCGDPGQLCCASGDSCIDGAACFAGLCIELDDGSRPICGADGTPCCRGEAADPDECDSGLQCETRNGGLFLCVVPGNAMMNEEQLDADSLDVNGVEDGSKSVNGLDDTEVYNIVIGLVCAVIVCGVFVGGYCWYNSYKKNTRKGHVAVDNQDVEDVDESEMEEVEHGIEEETETGALVTVELH